MKKYIQYILSFLAVLFLGFAVFFAIQQYRYRNSPEYQAIKYFDDLKSKYENDTYGGATPEETLQLFVDALKKGDVDLASKYFMVEEQEKQVAYLQDRQAKGLLNVIVENAIKLKLTESNEELAFFNIIDANNIVKSEVILQKNTKNKWKISEL